MVKYDVNLSTPGTSGPNFAKGFLGEIASIRVGPEKQHFQVPVEHLKGINYFANAFECGFKETSSLDMDLPDEDPAAFAIFLRWLYQGIPPAKPQGTRTSIATPVKLLLMADKWCETKFALGVAKHLSNLAIQAMVTAEGNRQMVLERYRAAGDHRCRFIMIHAALAGSKYDWLDGSFDFVAANQDDFPDFFEDFGRYAQVFNTAQAATGVVYVSKLHAPLSENKCHGAERFLFPRLFESIKFSAQFFVGVHGMCSDEAGQSNFIRKFLKM